MNARAAPAALLAAIALLWGCAARPIDRGAPKIVTVEIAPYAMQEECLALAAEERLDFRFESTEPVHFDLRYRDAGATVLLMSSDGVREHAAIYPVPETRPYCLAWEAGAAGAHLDYGFTVHAATP